MSAVRRSVLKLAFLSIVVATLAARPGELAAQQDASVATVDLRTAEGTVRHLYHLISAEAGSVPDWQPVRDLFLRESIVVLRTSRDSLSVLSLDGFIDDFAAFYALPEIQEKGFKETILQLKSNEFGDMAQVWVLYEARIPDGGGNQGLDNFSLVKRDGEWRVAAITNEVVFPARPVPEGLFD
jgi:hypothetical protein